MDEVHRLVPSVSTDSHQVLPNGENQLLKTETFHQILLGGDQLTAARCRGSIATRCDDDTSKGHRRGLVPIAEVWHVKYSLCKVSIIYKVLHYYATDLCYKQYVIYYLNYIFPL